MSEQSNPVVLFLINCGNENLQYLLVPARLDAAMAAIDTDSDGEITAIEWEEAIEVALRAKLAARAERRAKSSAAARKEIAEFTAEFLSAAREVFELMDEDDSGTLVVDEIVKAVDPKKGNKKVIKFLETCGEPNLQFLVRPKTIRRALRVLDVSGDGEIDIDEWRVTQRLFT